MKLIETATKEVKLEEYLYQDRVALVDSVFLEYEQEMLTKADRDLLTKVLESTPENKLPLYERNPHNSILLYVTGLTDEFDFVLGRSHTIGGSPPDIDVDYDPLKKQEIIQWVEERWGEGRVARINTHGSMKPKSLFRAFARIYSLGSDWLSDVNSYIPKAHAGIEPTLAEIVEGNPEKNYPPNPEFVRRFPELYKFASKLEGTIDKNSVHAAGVIIADEPITDHSPLRTGEVKYIDSTGKEKKFRGIITQQTMGELEAVGLLKYDFLVIENLSVLASCLELLAEHDIHYDIWNLPEEDAETARLLESGLLRGVFQLETSDIMKQLVMEIKPRNIREISDISAICRPGPLSANFDNLYAENKASGSPGEDLPSAVHEILKSSHYTLIYQEQIMSIASELAGFSLYEADGIRKAVGKKMRDLLEEQKQKFIEGCARVGKVDSSGAEYLWSVIVGFAEYGFNRSHSVAYSFVSWACAFLKAHHPVQFFCALMSVRSRTMQPEAWASVAPDYISEAKQMGIEIFPPSVSHSKAEFSYEGNKIYFGLSAIRDVGKVATRLLVRAQGKNGFADFLDYMHRIDRTKINTKVTAALIRAGCFDSMGYKRQDLLDAHEDYYEKLNGWIAFTTRQKEIEEEGPRLEENMRLIEERDALREKHRRSQLKRNPGEPLLLTEQERLEELEALKLKRKPPLKPFPEPEAFVELERHKTLKLPLRELIEQAHYIGCYLIKHPAHMVFPGTALISECIEGEEAYTAGLVTAVKTITTKKGQQMAFLKINDESGAAELTVFPRTYQMLIEKDGFPNRGDIIRVVAKCESIDPLIKLIANRLQTYRV